MYTSPESAPVYISRLTEDYYILPKNACKLVESHFHLHFLWQRVNEWRKIQRWAESGQHHENEANKTEDVKSMEGGREMGVEESRNEWINK
jgi:hypothetical protein